MIRLRGKIGEEDKSNKIYFEPRPGYTRGKGAAPSLEFPLIYGHKCPRCSNIMQALFRAPRAFSLWPYEETILLSQGEKNVGEVRRTYPDDKVRFGKSCYNMDFRAPEGGSVKITLKNHMMRPIALAEREANGDGLWEVGERPCTHTGVFSLREDLLVKDFLLFSQIKEHEIPKYNIPPIKDLIPEDDRTFKAIPSVGTAPPVILVERQNLVYGYYYETLKRMLPYKKSGIL